MNPQRVKTIILHSWFHLSHSMETWIDLFWFSSINLLVMGLIGSFISGSGNSEGSDILFLGTILWTVIVVGQYSITVGALWEIWSRSFSSLFITPLAFKEFVLGHMIGGLYKSVLVFLFTSILAILLYGFSIFDLGFGILFLVFMELLIFSWSAGIFLLGLILRFGTNIQSLAWGLIYLIQPLAAVFYPLSVLPPFLQVTSKIFPVTYVFEAVREKFFEGTINWSYFIIASLLNLMFFAISSLYTSKMLERGKISGSFARMES